MATQEVDELFGGVGSPTARTRTVGGLLLGGAILAVVGLVCSSLPGALLILSAWSVVERDSDRIESGYLPADQRGVVNAMRRVTYLYLGFVTLLLIVQGVLLCTGFYFNLWSGAVEVWLAATPIEVADPNAPPPPVVPPTTPGP